MDKKKNNAIENRKFIRLSKKFLVKFSIISVQDELLGINAQQGYTCNVSKGGLCLETQDLSESTVKYLIENKVSLSIDVHISLSGSAVKAVGNVCWYRIVEKDGLKKFILGVSFGSISTSEAKRLIWHARYYSLLTRIVWLAVIFCFLLLIGIIIFNR